MHRFPPGLYTEEGEKTKLQKGDKVVAQIFDNGRISFLFIRKTSILSLSQGEELITKFTLKTKYPYAMAMPVAEDIVTMMANQLGLIAKKKGIEGPIDEEFIPLEFVLI